MNNIRKNKCFVVILNCLLIVLLFSCDNGKWKKYETKNYSIDVSCTFENIYRTKSGEDRYFPFLPSGLYINCSKKEPPCLDFQKRHEDVGVYPMFNLLAVYKKGDKIIAKTRDYIKQINTRDPYLVEDVTDEELDGAEKVFDSEDVDTTFWGNYTETTLGLQDKRINRKYHVDFSTPVVRDIIRIGLYKKKFYFGETLHSYFVLDLKTDEVRYFIDKPEYDEYCRKNIDDSVEILEAEYLYN